MANVFKNHKAKGVGNTPVDIYTPNERTRATVVGLNCSNTSTSNIEVDIKVRDEQSIEYFLAKGVVVPRNSALAAIGGDQKLVLEPLETLVVSTNKENSIDVIVSVLEIIE